MKNIHNGIIVSAAESYTELDHDGRINFPTGNSLVYQREEGINGFAFDYRTAHNVVRLNDLVEDHRWRFVPVNGTFHVFVWASQQKFFPEVHIKIYPQFEEIDLDDNHIHKIIHELKKRLLQFDKKISSIRTEAVAEIFDKPLNIEGIDDNHN